MTISGIELTTTAPEEIMGMGGPYVADLYMGKQLISKNCIAGNFIYERDTKLLFFVKHHLTGNYHYFTINFFNETHNCVFEFVREFDMVYIKEFVGPNELKIYHAFHDNTESAKLVFKLDEEDFNEVVFAKLL